MEVHSIGAPHSYVNAASHFIVIRNFLIAVWHIAITGRFSAISCFIVREISLRCIDIVISKGIKAKEQKVKQDVDFPLHPTI